jgi:hypothetical protein
MGYEISLRLAWDELDFLALEDCTVSLLGEDYHVKRSQRTILREGGQPTGEMEAVLILHYLLGIARSGYSPSGEWISFKEAPGGTTFWPALEESTIMPLTQALQTLGQEQTALMQKQWRRRLVEGGDIAVEVETFPGILVQVLFWKGDDELPPQATMLFDQSLTQIYCTEDVAVLLMAVAQKVIEFGAESQEIDYIA